MPDLDTFIDVPAVADCLAELIVDHLAPLPRRS